MAARQEGPYEDINIKSIIQGVKKLQTDFVALDFSTKPPFVCFNQEFLGMHWKEVNRNER